MALVGKVPEELCSDLQCPFKAELVCMPVTPVTRKQGMTETGESC